MSVESAPPRYAQAVHRGLLLLGFIAALISFAALAYIAYEYTTRDELRNPTPQEHQEEGIAPSAPYTGA